MSPIKWPMFSNPLFASTCKIHRFPNTSVTEFNETIVGDPVTESGVTVIVQPENKMLEVMPKGFTAEDMMRFYFPPEYDVDMNRGFNTEGEVKNNPDVIEWDSKSYLVCEIMKWDSYTKVMAVRNE